MKRTSKSEAVFLGLGFNGDGHTRITKSKEFVVCGGSESTHKGLVAISQDTMRRLGVSDPHELAAVPVEEIRQACREAVEHCGRPGE